MRAAVFVTALTMMSFLPAAFAAEDASDSSTATAAVSKQGVDVRTIIASVSQRTHKKFLVDPRVAATVHLDGTVPNDVTYPLLLTILAVHAFAVYEQEGVVVVTPDANERFFPSGLVKPDEIRAPRLQSHQRSDGSFVSKPLEDLFPFLPREEFLANMIVAPLEE